MNKVELRNVIYTFEGNVELGFDPREVNCGSEEKKKRKGLFHRWADELVLDSNGQNVQQTYGIVEDLETGKVKNIVPIRIKFEN